MAGYSGTPLVKKIGIKPGHRVALLNAPHGFKKELVEIPESVQFVNEDGKSLLDVVIFFTKQRKEVEKELPRLRRKIKQNGMICVSWPKKASGVATDVTEDIIRDTALGCGLVDIKVCAVNDILSGLKLVIPVKDRKK